MLRNLVSRSSRVSGLPQMPRGRSQRSVKARPSLVRAVVAGKVQRDDFSGGLRVLAEDLLDLEGLSGRYAARLRLVMNGGADAKRLQQALMPYRASGPGSCLVVVSYSNGQVASDVVLGDAWRVRPDGRLIDELGAWLAPQNVQLLYGSAQN